MEKSTISDTEWAGKLRTLLESTGEAGISVRYKALGATLVASGCQLQVDERRMLTIPPPSKPLGQGGSALELELPPWADDSAHYRYFQDEKGGLYLSAEYQITHLPINYALIELATTPELLDASVNAPLVH